MVQMLLNIKRMQISQPAAPKESITAVDAAAKVNDFKKAMGINNQAWVIKAANPENRKGKNVTASRRTIDTGHPGAMRINEKAVVSADKQRVQPDIRPKIQLSASVKSLQLRPDIFKL